MGYPLWGQVPMVLSVLTIFFYADWALERGWRTEGTYGRYLIQYTIIY